MPDAARFADEGADTFDIFWRKQNFEYSESSQAWVSELKCGGDMKASSLPRGAFMRMRGSEQRKRYHDRTLGDDGD